MKASTTIALISFTASCGVAQARKSFLRSMYYEAKRQAKSLASEAVKVQCFSISNAESCVKDCQWLSCSALDVEFCAPSEMAAEGNKVCGSVDAGARKAEHAADGSVCVALNQTDCNGAMTKGDNACAWCSCSILGSDVEACLAAGDYAGYCDCDTPTPINATADDGGSDLKKLLDAEDLSPLCVNEKSKGSCAGSNDGCSWCSCSVIGTDFDVCLEDNAALQVGSYCDCTDQSEVDKMPHIDDFMFQSCETVPDPLNCTASTGIFGAHCELCKCNVFGRSLQVCVEEFDADKLFEKCSCHLADKVDAPENFHMYGYLTYR